MRRIVTVVALVGALAPAGRGLAQVASAEQQIAAAVLAAPEARRDGATVLGFDADGKLGTLRQGSNDLVCLADKPGDDQFSVACYHQSLEPYMDRGRELLAQGVTGMERNQQRWTEAEQGKLALPEHPATLYVLTGSSYDPQSGKVTDEYRRWVIYVPYATAESTGLGTKPVPGEPWLMFPGTAGAHVMISPEPK